MAVPLSIAQRVVAALRTLLTRTLGLLLPGAARGQLPAPQRPLKRVVIVGGGLAGATVAKALEKDADVTLIDSKDYFEIKWALLRALVEPAICPRVVFPHAAYLRGARLLVGTVAGASTRAVTLAGGEELPFDFLVLAPGMGLAVGEPADLQARIAQIVQDHEKIVAAQSVLVVGGGPTGMELAAEIATDFPDKRVTLVHGGPRLLQYAPNATKLAQLCQDWLRSKGVTVLLNTRVDVKPEQWGSSGVFTTSAGQEIQADFVAPTVGSRPSVPWLQENFASSLDNGFLKVQPTMQVESYTNIFAAGDIVNLKDAKQGYIAHMHGVVAAENIRRLMRAEERGVSPAAVALKLHPAQLDIALVSLGRNQGGIQSPLGSFLGWIPTWVKSRGLFIDKTHGDLGYKPSAASQLQALPTS